MQLGRNSIKEVGSCHEAAVVPPRIEELEVGLKVGFWGEAEGGAKVKVRAKKEG
jgi:hypothetical protein